MKKGYILALDQGTTSSRAIVFDRRMQPVAMSQQTLPLLTPKLGYVEQNADEIWQTQLSTAFDAINKAGLLATDINAIGITNQRETTLLWDKKTGKPLTPAIVWQDRRSHMWCDALKQQGYEPQVQAITGLKLDPYFSASKIVWLLNNVIGLKKRALAGEVAFGTVDSWLLYQLTGSHCIEITNASRTLLMDIHTGEWSDTLLALFDIPKAMLPRILPSNSDFGVTKAGLFSSQIPITAVMGDQQAALYGQGCTVAGMAKSTYGTGCFLLMNTGNQPTVSQHQLLSTVAWQKSTFRNAAAIATTSSVAHIPPPASTATYAPTYALEGSVFMAGAIVQWLRDNLGIIQDSNDIETLARQAPDSQGVVMIPAFTGLAAPYWEASATARIVGMTRGTTKSHIARAALEAIALQAYDVLHAMQKDSPVPLTELRVDGGAANNDTLMQYQADILGVPVLRPTVTEITAKGVAILAGESIGLWDNSIISLSWQLDKQFDPTLPPAQQEEILQRWHFHMQQTLSAKP